MLKTLKCDLARIISNWAFAAAVVVTAVLCFSVQVYTDFLNGKTYSVFEALFSFDRSFMAGRSEFFPPSIIRSALSGYSSMALPVTASFGFVLSFIAERNSGNMFYTVSRTSRVKYYFSKFITAISSGGLCIMLGLILFGIFVYILFPSANLPDNIEYAFPEGVFAALVKMIFSAFIYGMTSILPAFFLCSFCKNPYIILCLPFLLKFIAEALISKIQINAMAEGNVSVYEQTMPFYPDAVSSLVDRPVDKIFWEIIAVNVIFAAAVITGFIIIMEKRSDRGR